MTLAGEGVYNLSTTYNFYYIDSIRRKNCL